MIYGCRDQNLSNETDCQVYYAYSYIKYILLDTKHRLLQPNKFFTKNWYIFFSDKYCYKYRCRIYTFIKIKIIKLLYLYYLYIDFASVCEYVCYQYFAEI